MGNWITFFKERTPLASYILLAMGPAASGYFLSHNGSIGGLILSFLGFFIFLITLRMMDEYKDYEKDVVANPGRPLPRGIIKLPEFKKGINISIGTLLAFDALLFLMGLKCSFYLYTLIIVHLWLMYKEFYIAEWINARPLLYAVTHQLILVTIALFAISVYRGVIDCQFSPMDFIYALSVLFAFFSYEVCRKLDPAAHPILKTYRYVYGMNGVIKIVSTLLILHICAIRFLFQTNPWQFVFYLPIALLFTGLVLLKSEKLNFKLVELMSTLNLLIFLYSGIFYVLSN